MMFEFLDRRRISPAVHRKQDHVASAPLDRLRDRNRNRATADNHRERASVRGRYLRRQRFGGASIGHRYSKSSVCPRNLVNITGRFALRRNAMILATSGTLAYSTWTLSMRAANSPSLSNSI